jgi:predicted DNA-binding transcriptional regulator AlpA
MEKLLRFNELKEAGIVPNRTTLQRWIKQNGFPEGVKLGPNTRAWSIGEVEKWLDSRKTGGV